MIFNKQSNPVFPLGNVEPVAERPTSKFCKAVDLVRRLMAANQFGICDGMVYKKAGVHTYVFCSTVKDYLLNLLSNVKVADAITQHIQQMTQLLSEPACRLIKPIQIDYNFIEVLPEGMCFNIAKKCFDLNPEELKGSPRAYIRYKYEEGKIPKPKKFIEGKYVKELKYQPQLILNLFS